MGLGDQLIATGLAKGAWSKRGVRVAFGEGQRIIWDKNSELIFRNNPNIASPGNEKRGKIEWIPYYKGNRGYNKQGEGYWIWNMDWRCIPGEIYFMPGEENIVTRKSRKGCVLMEPNGEERKSVAPNKRWEFNRYQQVADQLLSDGYNVVQLKYGSLKLANVEHLSVSTFRQAAVALKNSALYIGPEGGLHHAAAAVGVRAVVIFGGFIPPSVTGYDSHANIVGSDRFCGSFNRCQHCIDAMDVISVEQVYNAAKEQLGKR